VDWALDVVRSPADSVPFESTRLITSDWSQSLDYTISFDPYQDNPCTANILSANGYKYLVGCTSVAVGQLVNYYLKVCRAGWLETMLYDVTVYPRFVDINGIVDQPCGENGCKCNEGYTTESSYADAIIDANSLEANKIKEFLWKMAIGLDAKFKMNTESTSVGPYSHEPYDWVNDSRDKIQSLLIDRFRFNPQLSHTDKLQKLDAEKGYIISSLNAGHPVLLSMYGTKNNCSDDCNAGHTAIIDAYKDYPNGNFYVKINMGWGNVSNTNDTWYDGSGPFHDAHNYINWDEFYIYKNTDPFTETHGTLSITSTPFSGEIYIDGVYKADGNWKGLILSGAHTITFGSAEGYITPDSQRISINADQVSYVMGTYIQRPQMTYFQIAPDIYSACLSWTKPSDTRFGNILIVRSNSPINWVPTDGAFYIGNISDDLEVIYNNIGTSCPDLNLQPNTQYHYKAFGYDEALHYSLGISASVTTLDIAEPTATSVDNFRGTTTASSINLYWDPPQDTDYQNYLVVRGSWVPLDNTEYIIGENGIIYKGTNTSCSDNSLTMGTDYQYNIYAYHKYSVYDEDNKVWNTYVDYGSGVSVNLRTKLGGMLSADITLNKDKNPHIVTSMLTITEGITLTITPGTIIKFQGQSSGITVNGTLCADGNLADGVNFDPIYMTSVNDHSIGGGTGSGNPEIEDWDTIRFNPCSINNLLRHVIVKWGGYDYSSNNPGLVEIYTSSLDIANSEFSDNYYGIYIKDASPRIAYSNILNNNGCGIYCTGNSSPIIEDNIIRLNAIGIKAENGATPNIINNSFVNNTSYAAYLGVGAIASIQGNTSSGNTCKGICINGTLTADSRLINNPGIPYIVSNVTISEGVTLTIDPGTIVKFQSTGSNLTVNGALSAEGTEESPIIFTSLKDDTYGSQ